VSSNKFMKGSFKTWWNKNKPDDDSDDDGDNDGDSDGGDGRDLIDLPYVTQKTWGKNCETPILRLLHEGSA
jgi:hypothetical protein